MSEHLDTVQAERAKYGTPLGEANAWRVINATAYTWRAAPEGWGLLAKPTGTNYNGYSIDVIVSVMLRQAVDCLGDAEGFGRPQWSVIAWDESFVSRWRPPVPLDPPDPPPDGLEARVAALETEVQHILDHLRAI
jgi:hypothetical protein